jgi:prepilin-type processing-associated H-X9-DG protein
MGRQRRDHGRQHARLVLVAHRAAWHAAGTALLFVDGHAKITKARDRYNEVVYGDSAKTACR